MENSPSSHGPQFSSDDSAASDSSSLRLPAAALLFQAPEFKTAPPVSTDEPPAPSGEERARESDAAETPRGQKSARSRGGSSQKKKKAAPSGSEASAQATDAPGQDTPKQGSSDDSGDDDAPSSRRRRGGRGRRKAAVEEEAAAEAGSSEENDSPPDDDSGDDDAPSSRRRRTRTRSRTRSGDTDRAKSEVSGVEGSTRLEAKRQRRREGREAGRRRQVITESEFLARRESVDRKMVVREQEGLNQIAVLEDGILVEHYVARRTQRSMVGNVYLGRVQNVLPSMEAAFVDLGKGRNAVLYAGEVNWDAVGMEGQPRRIEQALKSGDTVLVQVTKDPIGHKGARLTSQITLAGRHLVLVPSGAMTGISRKLPERERARLKKLLKTIVPSSAGVIVRTAAEGATEEQLRGDVDRLVKIWEDIESKAANAKNAPVLLKGEPELAVRVVRDVFNEDFSELIVSGSDAWKTISTYVNDLSPDLADRMTHWVKPADVFSEFRVDEQLAKGMDRKVWLPSGGSLVIDRTEAMTVIDVNTGRFTGSGGSLEETVTRNNLEAAEEIVRQLRLRDIGGIIVIDFIDMVLESNRDLVMRRLVECLGRDRTRHQVAEVTSLGLVQMTRKRVGQGLVEAFSEPCSECGGRGFIVHTSPVEKSGGDGGGKRRRGGNSGGSASATHPAPQTVTPDDPGRKAVQATLATIAAAAAHAHDEVPGGSVASEASADESGSGGDEIAPPAPAETPRKRGNRRAVSKKTAAPEDAGAPEPPAPAETASETPETPAASSAPASEAPAKRGGRRRVVASAPSSTATDSASAIIALPAQQESEKAAPSLGLDALDSIVLPERTAEPSKPKRSRRATSDTATPPATG